MYSINRAGRRRCAAPRRTRMCCARGSGDGRTEITSNAGFPGLGPLVAAAVASVSINISKGLGAGGWSYARDT